MVVMKKQNIFSALLASLIVTACVSTPEQPPPAWVLNTYNVYPESEYITGRGQGATRGEAETKARTAVSSFFLTQVNAEMSTRRVFTTEHDGITTEERQTIENAVIRTQGEQSVVRFAEDPWRDPKIREWITVAYIRRDEGWTVYEPGFRRQSEAFLGIIRTADAEDVPFNAFLRYGNAIAYANSSEYTAARLFASILHPTRARTLFAEADAVEASLPQKQLAAREMSRMYIESPVDYNNMVYQATVKALGNAGFAVERNRNNALTYCLVQVEEGEQKMSSGIFYNPVLTGIISGRNGSLFSFKIEGSRQGAVNQELAKRRAYTALSEALETAFADELARYQNTLIRN